MSGALLNCEHHCQMNLILMVLFVMNSQAHEMFAHHQKLHVHTFIVYNVTKSFSHVGQFLPLRLHQVHCSESVPSLVLSGCMYSCCLQLPVSLCFDVEMGHHMRQYHHCCKWFNEMLDFMQGLCHVCFECNGNRFPLRRHIINDHCSSL